MSLFRKKEKTPETKFGKNAKKSDVINIISTSNKFMRKCMRPKYMWLYHFLIVFSAVVYLLIIAAIYLLNVPLSKGAHCCGMGPIDLNTLTMETVFLWNMVLKIFGIIVLSLVFIWWMNYIGKLISESREAMKPWQKKVTDAYESLIEMDFMLYKAVCEKEKETI